MLHNPLGANQRNPFTILSSFLLIHIHSLGVNLAPSWTLFHEVSFYLVFATLLINKRLGFVICSVWFVGSLFFCTPGSFYFISSSYSQFVFSPYHLLFAFGLIGGVVLQSQRGPSRAWALLLGLGIFSGALIVQNFLDAEHPWLRILADAGLALALVVAAEREHLHLLHVPRFLGDASYSIYLFHYLLISTIAPPAFQLDQKLHLPLLVWSLFMFFSAVGFGILGHLWVERPLLRFLGKHWSGERNATA